MSNENLATYQEGKVNIRLKKHMYASVLKDKGSLPEDVLGPFQTPNFS